MIEFSELIATHKKMGDQIAKLQADSVDSVVYYCELCGRQTVSREIPPGWVNVVPKTGVFATLKRKIVCASCRIDFRAADLSCKT